MSQRLFRGWRCLLVFFSIHKGVHECLRHVPVGLFVVLRRLNSCICCLDDDIVVDWLDGELVDFEDSVEYVFDLCFCVLSPLLLFLRGVLLHAKGCKELHVRALLVV